MNTKLLNSIKEELNLDSFDLEHETNMVQARILSPLIEEMELNGITQEELAKITGLKQPFISGLLNIRKNLSMKHIALLQNALGVVLQPPNKLDTLDHSSTFYGSSKYNLKKRRTVSADTEFGKFVRDAKKHGLKSATEPIKSDRTNKLAA